MSRAKTIFSANSRRKFRPEHNPRREPLFSTKDIAEMLDVSTATVLNWKKQGYLKGGFRFSHKNVWPESEVRALIERKSLDKDEE